MSKQLLILARKDPAEAVRVAAGLTIFGHEVSLVLMLELVGDNILNEEQLELLELAEIEPVTTKSQLNSQFESIDVTQLGRGIGLADAVLSF